MTECVARWVGRLDWAAAVLAKTVPPGLIAVVSGPTARGRALAFRPVYGAAFAWETPVPSERAPALRRPSRFRYTSTPSITRWT